MKSFLDKLSQEINESTQSVWDYGDVIPVKTPQQAQQGQQGQGGQGQETKVIGKQGTQKPEDGQDGKGQDQSQDQQKGQQQGSGGGQVQQGQKGDDSGQVQSGEGGSKKTTTGQMDKGEGSGGDSDAKSGERGQSGEGSDISTGKEWMDDHSKIAKGDATGKSIINEVYKEVENEYRKRSAMSGSGEGNLMTKVKEMLKEEFDVGKILARIGMFKKKLSERIRKRETYQAAIYNPVTQQTTIMAKGSPKLKEKIKNSAVMFFAADTSGSITSEDYKSIFGYINDLATRFKKQQHGIDGDVYLIEWDTRVHTPIRKWEAVKAIKPKKDMSDEEREALSLRGGGGTNIQALFDFLDSQFVKNIDGEDYFVFADNMPAVTGKEPEGEDAKKKPAVSTRLKPAKKDYQEPSFQEGEIESARESEINIKEGGYSNIPFLIIYTDGYFSPPNIRGSKLFANNPGNILYIVTSKGGIQNVRPKNYLFHNLHGDDL